MAEAAAASSSSSSSSTTNALEKVRFWTRGPNVFTAVQEYFGDREPPIFAPTLLHRAQLEVVDEKAKYWSQPTAWFESGKRVVEQGNADILKESEDLSEVLSSRMFFENWQYYEKVTVPVTITKIQETPDMMVVALPEKTPEAQESVKRVDTKDLIEIRPKTLMWVISAATIMGTMNKDVVPIIVPKQQGGYNASFDLHKHFDLRSKDNSHANSNNNYASYFKMMLLTVGALFHCIEPAEPINNGLFVSAHWKHLSYLRNAGLSAPLSANFDIQDSPHVLLTYQHFQRCFEALFSEEISKARLNSDQFLV